MGFQNENDNLDEKDYLKNVSNDSPRTRVDTHDDCVGTCIQSFVPTVRPKLEIRAYCENSAHQLAVEQEPDSFVVRTNSSLVLCRLELQSEFTRNSTKSRSGSRRVRMVREKLNFLLNLC